MKLSPSKHVDWEWDGSPKEKRGCHVEKREWCFGDRKQQELTTLFTFLWSSQYFRIEVGWWSGNNETILVLYMN